MRNFKPVIVISYIMAGIWLTTNIAFAFYSFTLPIPQPLAVLSKSDVTASFNLPEVIPSVIEEDLSVLRDPFTKIVPVVAVVQKSDIHEACALRVKAIILSLKSGIVLEDTQSGAVYFLSEGEIVNGIAVKNIAKSDVTIEMNGKQIVLSLEGNQK